MGFLDWLFKKTPPPAEVEVDLDALMQVIPMWATRYRDREVNPRLLRTRVADGCRLAGLRPLPARAWQRKVAGLDDEGLRRLWIVNEVARVEELEAHLPALFPDEDAGPYVAGLLGAVEATAPVTMELLSSSPLRIEEMARHVAARLGVRVAGESAAESQARLERLDYRNLLAEAERAQESAEARMEYLRKLQEDLEARRMPRGKW